MFGRDALNSDWQSHAALEGKRRVLHEEGGEGAASSIGDGVLLKPRRASGSADWRKLQQGIEGLESWANPIVQRSVKSPETVLSAWEPVAKLEGLRL